VPSACQNGARTENTEHEPGTRQTRTDQGNRSWLPTMRQPEKRTVGTAGGEGWRVRVNNPETPSTRATSTWRTVHAGARAPVPRLYGSGRPAFSPPTVLRGRGRIFPHQRGEPRTRIRAISGPLASVHSGQLQPSGSNEPPSSAHLAAMINTPSKLVLRIWMQANIQVEVWVSSPEPAVGGSVTPGTRQDRL